jgi:parallel beta-helix repeat protein
MKRLVRRALCALVPPIVVAVSVLGATQSPASAAPYPFGRPPTTLSVGCWPGGLPTIGAAVSAAIPGDTIRVCWGVYREGVVVPPTKPLTIQGIGNPLIDATGHDNGIVVASSHSSVRGFTVEHATGEGILVVGQPGAPVSGVTIAWNTVVHNDLGNPTGAPIGVSSYPECNAQGQVPGDCGEGIHLMVARNSTVVGNRVAYNSGGVLITDEFGPSSGNLVAFNNVHDNTLDCGVTVVGHNPGAFQGGRTQPTVGGVFANTIADNAITGNGLAGQGAGVVLATGPPGGAVYDNVVRANRISNNGLAGITVHSHAPGQDLNGNVLDANIIGTNNLDGDYDFSPMVNPYTTGIVVAAVAPLGITITRNLIVNNQYGIWLLPAVSATGLPSNTFQQVGIPVVVAS